MKNIKLLISTLCLLIALPAAAQTIPQQLQQAFYRNDITTLQQMLKKEELQSSKWQSVYYRSFAHVHIARVTMFTKPDDAMLHLQKAEYLLEEILETHSDQFEIWILLVSAKGLMVGASGGSKFWKGLQAGSTLKKAAEVAPNHPKVRFEEAIGLIFSPAWFGKDLDKATALLQQNLNGELSNPDWVPDVRIRADNHAWLAYIALEQKKAADASHHIKKALQFRPDFEFVLKELTNKHKQLIGGSL